MSTPYELGRLTGRKPPFRYSALTRVSFSDTDAQGVVYYGRYMPYFDLSRTEYHRHLGLRMRGMALERGEFAMRASTVEYVAPARFDDLLEIFVRVASIGESSVRFEHAAYRLEDDRLMCTAEQVIVFVDAERRKARVPDSYRDAVARFEELA